MRHPVLCLALSLCSAPACSSSTSDSPSSSQGDGGTLDVGAGGSPGAAGAAGSAGAPDLDGGCTDCQDGGLPDAGGAGMAGAAGSDTGTGLGDAGVYAPCHTPDECQQGLSCVTVVQQPAHGQCTHDCVSDDDCEASPSGNQVGCHPQVKICLSLCGVYGGECPPGLVCTAHEFCLEPSNVQATKGPGEHCVGAAECVGEAECVEGENTSAYCAPLCSTNEDCAAAAPGHVGQCINASGMFSFCMFFCGMMAGGAPCPGDLVCEANSICR